jgi:hypothetical protein
MASGWRTWRTGLDRDTKQSLCLESRMHENVPVRFGRGRLDSLVIKGLAAYLITYVFAKRLRI